MGKLDKKKALITGSSSGIGAGVALEFACEGADVVVNYLGDEQKNDAKTLCQKIAETGQNATAVQADVSLEDDVDRLVSEAHLFLGGIDILVNNAGIAHASVIEEMPVAWWDKLIAVNLRSVFLVTRKVIPGMYKQGHGKIISTASQLAYKGAAGFSHYTATKGAILSFTRSLALEIGERNININAVAPWCYPHPDSC